MANGNQVEEVEKFELEMEDLFGDMFYWEAVERAWRGLERAGVPGEAVHDCWWLLTVERPSSRKAVLRVDPARPLEEVAMQVLYRVIGEEVVTGAKIMAGAGDWLAVIYFSADDTERLPPRLLPDLVAGTGGSHFVPYNASVDRPCSVWVGDAASANSLCWPAL